MGKIRSNLIIWKYFIANPNTRTAICRTCGKTISFRTTTSNLKQHLRNKHPRPYEELVLKIFSKSIGSPAASHEEIGSADENSHQTLASEHDDDENDDGGGNDITIIPSSDNILTKGKEVLWSYFVRDPGTKLAVCTSCNKTLSYKTTIANLKQHLRLKHVRAYEDMVSKMSSDEVEASVVNFVDEDMDLKSSSVNGAEVVTQAEIEDENSPQLLLVSEHGGEDVSGGEVIHRTPHSILWNYYVPNPKTKLAVCNFCNKVISYKTTITNLKQHLRLKHVRQYEDIVLKKSSRAAVASITNSTDNKSRQSSGSESGDEEDSAKIVRRKDGTKIWDYYVPNPKTKLAVCNFCDKVLSYKTTIGNLRQHLRIKHARQYKDIFHKKSSDAAEASTMDSADNKSRQSSGSESGDEEDGAKMVRRKTITIMWNYFVKNEETKSATCKICEYVISYKTTLTNVKSHLRLKHARQYEDMIIKANSAEDVTPAEIEAENQLSATEQDEDISDGKIPRRNVLSITRNYFVLNSKMKLGVCKFCYKTISYKTTITNLKSHLRTLHVRQYEEMVLKLARREFVTPPECEAEDGNSRQSWASEQGGGEDIGDDNTFYIVADASLNEHFISEVNDIVVEKKKECTKTIPKKQKKEISEPQKDQRYTIEQPSPSTASNAGTGTAAVSSYRNEDEYTAIGITVEVKLRKMQYDQRLYAENLINQTLYKGLLFQLTEHSTIVTKSDGDERESSNKRKTSAGSKRPAFVSVEAKKRKRSMEDETSEEEMDVSNMITEEVHDSLLNIKTRDTDSSDE